MSGSNDPRGAVAFQAAHRPEPGFPSSMIGLDRITGLTLDGMQRRGISSPGTRGKAAARPVAT
jgi:hypothetical protein